MKNHYILSELWQGANVRFDNVEMMWCPYCHKRHKESFIFQTSALTFKMSTYKMELYCCFERNFKHSVVFDRCKNEIFKLVCSWLHHRKWSRMELFSGFIFIKSHEKQKQKNNNVLPFMAKADHKYMLVFLNKSTKWNYSLQLFREIIQTAICWKLF